MKKVEGIVQAEIKLTGKEGRTIVYDAIDVMMDTDEIPANF